MNDRIKVINRNTQTFKDMGTVFGLFEIRNFIEALILTLPLLLLCFKLLPFEISMKLVSALSVAVPIGGFALIDDRVTHRAFTRHGRSMIRLYLPCRTALVLKRRAV